MADDDAWNARSALRAVGAARNDAFLSAPCRACPQTVQRKRDSNHKQPQRAPPQRVAQSHARSLLSACLSVGPVPHGMKSAQTLSMLSMTADRAATGVRRSETYAALPRLPGACNAVLERANASVGAHGRYAHARRRPVCQNAYIRRRNAKRNVRKAMRTFAVAALRAAWRVARSALGLPLKPARCATLVPSHQWNGALCTP